MNRRSLLLRLAGREYLPLAGWVLCWSIITAAIGTADAARLLAATMLVRAVRALTALDTGAAMRRRHGASREVLRTSLRRAIRIEALSLLAGLAVLAAIVWLLWQLGQPKAAGMTVLVGIALPARHFAPARGGRRRGGVFRFALAWSGVALASLFLAAGGGFAGAALAMGLREWAALAIALAVKPPAIENPHPVATPLTFREVAAITVVRARHRLTYRVGKGVLAAVLGPFGGIVARTGRGAGMHRRFERFTPQRPLAMSVLALGAAAIGIGLLWLVREPATLVVSATLIRIAAAAGSVLIWWRYADADVGPDEADDDDDD